MHDPILSSAESSGSDDEWALGDFRINAQADSVR